MKSVSRIALGAVLALSGSAMLFASPADAQRRNRQQAQQAAPATPGQRQLNLTDAERAVLVPLQTAAAGADRAAQDAALAAAAPVVRGADARYMFGLLQLQIGQSRQDYAMASQGVEAVIASGSATAEEVPTFLGAQAELAMQGPTPNLALAERAYTQLLQLQPNNVNRLVEFAQVRDAQNNRVDAVRLLQRAIEGRHAEGGQPPENWYKFVLSNAYASNDPALRAQSPAFGRALVTAYPTATNWRDALTIYREVSSLDQQAQLDVYRLARVAGALNGERDYGLMAEILSSGGYPAEAKAVLDQGVSSNMITASAEPFRNLLQLNGSRVATDRAELAGSQRDALAAASGTPALRTADALYGHGRYADAVTLYRAALQKGGVDANVVNTRLGMALAAAGQRAEAEAAFRAVTGPRAELAQFWLVWLSQRPAG